MKTSKVLTAVSGRVGKLHPAITRTKLAIFAMTLIVVGVALGGLETAPPASTAAYSESLQLELPSREAWVAGPAPLEQNTLVSMPRSNTQQWQEVKVRPGQTLDTIFRNQGFSIGLLHEILALSEETRNLKKIRPGDTFGFQRSEDGSLAHMRYPVGEASYLVVDATGEALTASRIQREVSTEINEAEGTIKSSLFLAGKRAGLNDGMIMKLANIFGWDIDFVLDIRSGDRFFLLYAKVYRDGEFLRDGEILAASFVNQGEKYQAVRFELDGAGRYFAPDGRPMRKAFLRAPLNFSYISSNFSPERFHPILKRVKAHNGIDYRAPTGTPVYAAGDGRVTLSTYSQYNGHHVFIQHANSITTKYLHFSKRTVKQGDRVQQGQVIGYVGATGLAQAPHLHYEFVLNGVHRNPRTISLPKVEPLEGTLLSAFSQRAAPYLNQLSRLESASLYASRE